MPAMFLPQQPEAPPADPSPGTGIDFSSYFFFPWAIVLQVLAAVHLIRRGGNYLWFWIILFGGGLGAAAYILIEVVPDFGLLREALARRGRKAQIQRMEATVLENPSAGNLEDLGELYFDQKEFAKAREAFDRAIAARADSTHTFYRRGQCAVTMKDFPAAIEDLERVYAADAKFDYYNAAASLAYAHGKAGNAERAEALFEFVAPYTTNLETLYEHACFLKALKRMEDARAAAQRLLDKKATLPRYMQRRQRPWFQRASALLKELRKVEKAPA
jgi:hypothetical protein